jgi:hypothetical protein
MQSASMQASAALKQLAQPNRIGARKTPRKRSWRGTGL